MRRQPGQVSQLTQHTHPRMRHHAMTVCRYFHPPRRRDILHLRSASPARADRTLDKSILHCETGTFAYQHPATDEPARKIQASFSSLLEARFGVVAFTPSEEKWRTGIA